MVRIGFQYLTLDGDARLLSEFPDAVGGWRPDETAWLPGSTAPRRSIASRSHAIPRFSDIGRISWVGRRANDFERAHGAIDDRLARDCWETAVEAVDLGGDERGVLLTEEGRHLLDSHTLERDDEAPQAFYAGVSRSREIDHDSNLYATYRQEEARLRDEHSGLDIRRVILEQDLKREYQEFLQEHNRHRFDSDGRPDRDDDEIRDWAREHDLPFFDGQVHFPDYRIEYEVDGRERHEDIELFTPHYRGAHAASRAKTGFRIYVVGSRGGGGRFLAASARHGGIPVTHEYPHNPTFDSVSVSRVMSLGDVVGFTQRQREFLVTVMVHSGCFLERQYCTFTGTTRGQNSREFVARLVARGLARAIEPGPVRTGRLYHVHHKPLYEVIGQPDDRNRRLHTIGRMVERVMILDAVLSDRRCWWLSPEADKRTFFDVTKETGLRPEEYPHISFGLGSRRTVRCLARRIMGRRVIALRLTREASNISYRHRHRLQDKWTIEGMTLSYGLRYPGVPARA